MELNLSEPGQSRYLRVYEYYKELIVSWQMKPGAKLPSIRKCSLQLQLSRTTVETAYMLLAADGYIISRPQSGFYVTDAVLAAANREEIEHGVPHQEERPEIRYDFASSNVDRESFQFDLWRRYVKSALRQDERLLSYGEPQGEREFREALCAYLGRHRNVICTPDSIVVGAGVQSLLHILCPMLRERDSAWFFNPSFRQGRQIFEDYGFRTGDIREYWESNDRRIESSKKDLCGIEKPDVCAREMKTGLSEQMSEAMRHTGRSVCYLTPSQMTVWGEVMPVGDRMKLLKDAAREDMLIIEDDYNSEFRYYNRPTPSLQGLSGGRGVVYLGTFSRLLLPSIRMSYMVLPPDLLKRYQERGRFYNQTASKAEQIALCQFIRDGHLESQIRKSKKLYAAKAKCLCDAVRRIFGEKARTHLGDAGFLVLMELDSPLTSAEIAGRAAQAGVAVRPVESVGSLLEKQEHHFQEGYPKLLLSCASMGAERYEEALEVLKEVVYKKEK